MAGLIPDLFAPKDAKAREMDEIIHMDVLQGDGGEANDAVAASPEQVAAVRKLMEKHGIPLPEQD